MKLEQQQLDECQLNSYITEKLAECKNGRDKVIAELNGKLKHLRKEIKKEEENNETMVIEAGKLSGVVTFLKKSSLLKLMVMALLSKKSLQEKCNNADAMQKQRAVYLFASHKSIKPIILNFRNQHPDWKVAKALLKAKTQKNKEIGAKVKGDEAAKKKGGKNKKKIGKKSLKRKNSEIDEGRDNDENCLMPKKKKKKVKKESTDVNGLLNGDASLITEEKVESPSNSPQNKKSKKGYTKFTKVKKLVCETTTTTPPSDTTATESMQSAEIPEKQNSWQNGRDRIFGRGGRFNGRGGRFNGGGGRFNGGGGRFNGGGNRYSNRGSGNWRGGRQMRFPGRDNANNIVVPADWQNKAITAEGQDSSKPSLLRPAWLTNPEEHKPAPISNEQGNFRGRRGSGNNWRSRGSRGNFRSF